MVTITHRTLTVAAVTLLASLLLACSRLPFRETANLKIEAQIIYNMGGPQPVAQETVYLLDTSFDDIVKSLGTDSALQKSLENFKTDPKGAALLQLLATVASVNKSRATGTELNAEPMMKGFAASMPAWQSHIVKTAQTDFHGQALFQDVVPGDYWITAITSTRAGFALWNYRISLHNGENDVSLSQNNALYSK